MTKTSDFQARRLENIKRNGALLENLGVNQQAKVINDTTTKEPAKKKRKVEKTSLNLPASRSSARIASAPSKPTYNEDNLVAAVVETNAKSKSKSGKQRISTKAIKPEEGADTKLGVASKELEELQASWSSWESVAPPPTRDEEGTFYFSSHPDFTPNRSPEEVLREGCFGGSYFRPLYSKKLGITISNDCLELPSSWTTNLNIPTYLTSPTYNPEINKFKVACGQSIEQWEEAGWINHEYDVRGWFQWYCRFFMGRRCDDDERQVSRWKKCVGQTGRWRRMLLKKYMAAGVREVWDDGEEEEQEEVSPVMHQTCHHWAFCVTQEILDEYWRTGK